MFWQTFIASEIILTGYLKVSSPAGDIPRTVAGPAPVLPTVRLLLALLGPQEEQTMVGQQDPAGHQYQHYQHYQQRTAGLSSLSYISARWDRTGQAATRQKTAFAAFRGIFCEQFQKSLK